MSCMSYMRQQSQLYEDAWCPTMQHACPATTLLYVHCLLAAGAGLPTLCSLLTEATNLLDGHAAVYILIIIESQKDSIYLTSICVPD